MNTNMTPVLKDRIAEILKKEIYLGHIADGEELTQEVISEKLGVSRMPIREAFLQLESEGVLIRLKNRHVRVVGMTQERVKQLLKTLSAVETSLIPNLMRLEGIEAAYERFKLAVPLQGTENYTDKMMHYHLALSESIDNPVLHQMHVRLLSGYPQFLYLAVKPDWKWLLQEHTKLHEALMERQHELAQTCLSAYYDQLFEIVKKECQLA